MNLSHNLLLRIHRSLSRARGSRLLALSQSSGLADPGHLRMPRYAAGSSASTIASAYVAPSGSTLSKYLAMARRVAFSNERLLRGIDYFLYRPGIGICHFYPSRPARVLEPGVLTCSGACALQFAIGLNASALANPHLYKRCY